MEPVYLSIQQEATGKRMKTMIRDRGYSVKDIQEAMGFENPQAVYKWLSGKSLPSLDNFLILSRILHTSIEDILVVDGDIAVLKGGTTRRLDKYKKEEKEKNFRESKHKAFALFLQCCDSWGIKKNKCSNGRKNYNGGIYYR